MKRRNSFWLHCVMLMYGHYQPEFKGLIATWALAAGITRNATHVYVINRQNSVGHLNCWWLSSPLYLDNSIASLHGRLTTTSLGCPLCERTVVSFWKYPAVHVRARTWRLVNAAFQGLDCWSPSQLISITAQKKALFSTSARGDPANSTGVTGWPSGFKHATKAAKDSAIIVVFKLTVQYE